ncbi:MAG: M23 family metallopeptidase [Candidatus Aureabacteria bacterium]|nr:M23 family metallopeptidase [Candidatus Auribacterota bacterium]
MKKLRTVKTILISLSLFLGVKTPAGAGDSSPVFPYPLRRVTHKTGSFGEFRNDHFHAGIDISTYGETGWDVICPVDGYVSRVKVSSFGYGKAIYLTTTDGQYMVVFAHLMRFRQDIDAAVRDRQFQSSEYFQDFCPEKDQFRVSRGEVIALTGDTGGVYPHLHYEVRDSFERPQRFSIKELEENDTVPPVIKALAVHPLEADSVVNGKHEVCIIPLFKESEGTYSLRGQKIYASGKVGLSLYAFDESKGNKLGLSHVSVVSGEKSFFTVDIPQFSYDIYSKLFFAYSREAYLKTKNGFLNLFEKRKKSLPFYSQDKSGIIDIRGESQALLIEAFDRSGNASTAHLEIIPFGAMSMAYKDDIVLREDKLMFYSDSPATAEIVIDGICQAFPLSEEQKGSYRFVYEPADGQKFRQVQCRIVKGTRVVKEKNIMAVMVEPDQHKSFTNRLYFLESFKDSVEKRQLIAVKEIHQFEVKNDELKIIDEQPVVSLEPISNAYWQPLKFGAKLDGKDEDTSRTAFFIDHFGKWEFLSSTSESGYRIASLATGGILAVLRDETAPAVFLVFPKDGILPSKGTVEVKVSDLGSGIDYEKMAVEVDGVKVPYEVNTRNEVVKLDLDKSRQENRSVRIYIRAVDNTGNKSEKVFPISFR